MSDLAIDVCGVHLALQRQVVLDDVNLQVPHGDYVGILGPNGGGKTMLLRILLGLVKPDRGTVHVLGKPPHKARGEVAYVPQYAHFDLTFPISVRDVALMGRMGGNLFHRPNAADRKRVDEALETVGMSRFADRQIGKLSGGQVQRVLIARALTIDARLMLLDEPTANLDLAMSEQIYKLLSEVARNRTVLVVSHDIGVVSSYIRSVGCLNRRLYFHDSHEITREMIESTYGCSFDLLTHEHTHRVLGPHDHKH